MKKNILPIILFIALAVTLAGAFWQSHQSSSIEVSETTKLNQVRDQLILDVKNHDPRVAMENLAIAMQKNGTVLRNCHSLAHEIGDSAYAKYGDVAKALSYKNEICGSGYFHGVIESHIGASLNLETALDGLCSHYTDIFDTANCYHGVGHGLMFISDNNVPISLARCNAYADMKARIHCSEGVFMENFNSDLEEHPSAYLDINDPLSVCRTQKVSYQKATCYFYAPLFYLTTHAQKYNDAFDWCLSSENNFIDSCIKGVASRATKANIQNIPYVENLCDSIAPMYQSACSEGIGSYYTTEYADRTVTKKMCLTLRKDFQAPCLNN